MSATTVRIRIEDLPTEQILTPEQQAALFGAGPQRRLGLESLEAREVLAASITAKLVGDVLKIEGTEKADKIYVLQSDGDSKGIWVGSTPHGSQYGKFVPTAARPINRVEVLGLGGSDTIDLNGTGTAHHLKVDSTVWGDYKNVEAAAGGNDRITGGDGRDWVYGGAGNDTVNGLFDVDRIWGNAGNDTLHGSSGGDYLFGGAGNDLLDGGLGGDKIDVTGGGDRLTVVQLAEDTFESNGRKIDARAVQKYLALGGEAGTLGKATGDTRLPERGVLRQDFERGCIYWGADSGAVAVRGEMFKGRNSHGGYAELGRAIKDEVKLGTNIYAQEFARGMVYRAADASLYAVTGRFWTKFVAQGGFATVGEPWGDAVRVASGVYRQRFAMGMMYSSVKGTFLVGRGPLHEKYLALGGPTGTLGLPTSEGVDFGGGWWGHTFENGSIRGKDGQLQVTDPKATADITSGLNTAKGTAPALPIGTIDLTNEQIARKVADKLRSLAQGNERSADVTSLQVDTLTGDVRGDFYVRHRHTWRVNNPFGDDPLVVAYDSTMRGSFRYNIYHNEITGSLDLGRGIKVSLKDIYAVIQGDFSGWLLGSVGLQRVSNYGDRVAAMGARFGGAQNVFYASESFADWCGPETLARWGVTAYATGGSSLAAIPAEIATRIRAEATGIANWLKSRIGDSALQLVDKLANVIASRQNISTPHFEIVWDHVQYRYASSVFPAAQSPPVTHAAYAVVLKF